MQLTSKPGEANTAVFAVCIIIAFVGWFFPDNQHVKTLYELRGNFVQIFDGRYWLLITGAFFHGGAMHLIFNMLLLWQLGNVVEEAVGSARYMLLVVATAFVSSGIQLAFVGPCIGMSGVVCGLVGFMWQARGDYGNFYLWMSNRNFIRWMIMITILIPIDYFILNYGEGFGIAHVAHFVGIAIGAAIGRLASPTYETQQKMPVAVAVVAMLTIIILVLVYPVRWSRTRMIYEDYKSAMSEYERYQLKLEALKYSRDKEEQEPADQETPSSDPDLEPDAVQE